MQLPEKEFSFFRPEDLRTVLEEQPELEQEYQNILKNRKEIVKTGKIPWPSPHVLSIFSNNNPELNDLIDERNKKLKSLQQETNRNYEKLGQLAKSREDWSESLRDSYDLTIRSGWTDKEERAKSQQIYDLAKLQKNKISDEYYAELYSKTDIMAPILESLSKGYEKYDTLQSFMGQHYNCTNQIYLIPVTHFMVRNEDTSRFENISAEEYFNPNQVMPQPDAFYQKIGEKLHLVGTCNIEEVEKIPLGKPLSDSIFSSPSMALAHRGVIAITKENVDRYNDQFLSVEDTPMFIRRVPVIENEHEVLDSDHNEDLENLKYKVMREAHIYFRDFLRGEFLPDELNKLRP